MNKTFYKTIDETLYHEKLPNGLNIYLLPKPGFHKTYATISTPLGSNVTNYTFEDENHSIPLGVAHFLEHKLFDRNGNDISEEFAMNDAHVNAFTMNNRTTYLFSCTDNLDKNITTLLDFVFNPIFTEEGVKKEIGIINQEIKMYEDDPNTTIYMGALKNMFEKHPVRNDILGTKESISSITADILTNVHKAFYNPANMIMFITGNIDVENTISTIKALLNEDNEFSKVIITNITTENTLAYRKKTEIEHDILQPNCLLGIKLDGTNLLEEDIMKKELTYSILFDIIIGKSTNNYKKLIENQLINDSFGMDITLEGSYGYILLGSNSNYPEELYSALKSILFSLPDTPINKTHFERTKKQIIGGFINALNSLEYIANQFTKYHLLDTSLFNIIQIAKDITLDDIENAKQTLQNKDSFTTVTVFPKKKGE